MDKQTKGVKMSVLAERSGVPASTIKHYIREGLLPDSAVRTSRNMAWYDESLVDSIKVIRELQRERYLPLKVIKDLLDGAVSRSTEATQGLKRALLRTTEHESVPLQTLINEGASTTDLNALQATGMIQVHDGDAQLVEGDDVLLVRTLLRARQSGFDEKRLPIDVLLAYREAVAKLVRFEWQILASTVLSDSEGDAESLAAVGAELGETLVTLLRRKQLIPRMEEMNKARF